MKKSNIIISTGLIILLLLLVFFPYIRAEYLTFRYGNEFIGLEQQTGILYSSTYHKVIEYSEKEATVFYVSSNTDGNVITFKKENNAWILDTWKTIWSFYGSADQFYWPYYK